MARVAFQLDSADWVYADVERANGQTVARIYNIDVLDAEAADSVFAKFTNAVSPLFPGLQVVREDRFERARQAQAVAAAETPTEPTEAPVETPQEEINGYVRDGSTEHAEG